MNVVLKPWVPKTETYVTPDGTVHVRPDYWSRPYPATAKMQAAIQAGLERPWTRERDVK